LAIVCVCVCVCVSLTKDTEEDEQKLTKSTSLLESQHHHLLNCLEKTTVGTLEHVSVSDSTHLHK